MLRRLAVVISWENQVALVSCNSETVCNNCIFCSKDDNQLLSSLKTQTCTLAIQSEQPLVSGQKVEIGISEKSFIRLAIFIYLLPLLGLFVVSGFFNLFFNTDFASTCGAVLGGISSFLIVHNLSKKVSAHRNFYPVILNLTLPPN